MGYAKVITYGDQCEIYRYERDVPSRGPKKRGIAIAFSVPLFSFDGKDIPVLPKQKKPRNKSNARRAKLAFYRLVRANLSVNQNPVFASFTYRENMGDVGQGRKDFAAFARNAQRQFGSEFKYISVAEFQERGAVHFHALLWGITPDIVAGERLTRLVASLWGKGFVDLVQTDGSPKLAGYLAKYMLKNYYDERMLGRKLYITSRNVLKPVVDKDAMVGVYFQGGLEGFPDLSTATIGREAEYDTTWLGRCHYKRYNLS